MNPSSALATVVIDELVRNGVRDVVLSPGSRSAPLAYALHDAETQGRLRLHVRIDERTAGFLALGLAKESGVPAAVVTTSGTAVANLHPAVVEASYAAVPLIAITADRPPELRGVGANQTIDQVGIYRSAVRASRDLGVAEDRAPQQAYWRSAICRSVVAASGSLTGDPGPVHLNLALREPLVPTDGGWHEPLDGRPGGAAWTAAVAPRPLRAGYPGAPRTLVVLGQASAQARGDALALAAARGWPVLDELDSAVLLDPAFGAAHLPQRVLVIGSLTISRAFAALLRHPAVAVDVVSGSPRWAGAGSVAQRVLAGVDPTSPGAMADTAFAEQWRAASAAATAGVRAALQVQPLCGPSVAMALAEAAPAGALVYLGASSAIRDAAAVGGWGDRQLLANRGASGIDGTVSSAVGAALSAQRRAPRAAYALLGDLTFLHDANGLVIGPEELRPDLCLVVVNDNGGSIFARLEQGDPQHSAAFERVFGTPHGVALEALCQATGTPHEAVTDPAQLAGALSPRRGLRVVEVAVDRAGVRDLQHRLEAAAAAAAAASVGAVLRRD